MESEEEPAAEFILGPASEEPVIQLSDLGQAAVDYAIRGYRVFPLAPRDKYPITNRGLYDATTDVEQITAWWTRTPNANIGFATGSGIYVLDVDGETGEEALSYLVSENLPLPPTREVRTGKGRHLYFKYKEHLGNTAGRLGLNLDTRGDGGYVVLPPSVHPDGGVYQWAVEGKEATLPQWLIDRLEKRKPQFEFVLRDPNKKSEYTYGDFHPYIAKFFHNKCNALSFQTEGGRNHRLNELAFECGRIAQGGLGNAMAMESAVKDAARQAGLRESEIEKTWDSGYKSGWLASPFVLADQGEVASTGLGLGMAKHKIREVKPGSLIITPLSKVKHQEVEFLWGNRLVRRGINLLVGDGGLGKSALALHIAASVTDGYRLPDDQDQTVNGKVMLVSYEDPGSTVKQRAKVLGVDLDKLFIIEGVQDEELETEIQFGPTHVLDLIAALENPDYQETKLLIIDPWGRYLDDDDNREKLIRRAMAPLEKLCRDLDITVLILGHTNKRQEYSAASSRISGHNAFKNVARSVIMVGNIKGDTNAVAHVKHNWSRQALACVYTWDDDKTWSKGENPLEWGEVTYYDEDQLFQPKNRTKIDRAETWLRQLLIGNPMPVADIKAMIEDEEADNKFSWSTVEKASQRLGVVADYTGNQHTPGGRQTHWSLPDTKKKPNSFQPNQTVEDDATGESDDDERDFVPAPPPLAVSGAARTEEGLSSIIGDWDDDLSEIF